MTPCIQWSI